MHFTYGNIISTIILLVSIGIWVGGTNAKVSFNEKLDTIEQQIIIWLDDAETQRKINHKESMNHIMILHDYNKSQNPKYIIPEVPILRRAYQ